MQLATFSYTDGSGWSVDEFPSLDSEQTLVFVFAAPEYYEDANAIRQLVEHFPSSHVIGCSTSGEILGHSLNDRSLSVAVAKFGQTEVRGASAQVSNSYGSYEAAQAISAQLRGDNLRAVFVLSDGLQVNGSELVRGFNENLPEDVVVTGGLAGDGSRFERTFVIKEGKPVSGMVSAVGLYGSNLVIGHGSKGGWDKFGHERVVTRSKGNVLYELDGKPALSIYKEYLGERASGLPASALLFPLSIRSNELGSKQLVRTVLAVDEDTNSMTFAGDIPQGSIAQFLFANFDRLISGASDAAQVAQSDSEEAVLAIGISCVGRRLVLCDRTEQEIDAALELFSEKTGFVGFYSYGEISPYANGACDLHNQSMTITTYSEAA